jgi:DHA1 family multidrug resistance protein-like MFS transporter
MSRSSSKDNEGDNKDSASWRRNLRVIWLAEFMAVVAFYVIVPILPLYLRELGVENERQARLWSGLVFSVSPLTMAVMGPVWGALSDQYGRKVMVERAMLSGAIVIGSMGLVQNVQQLAALRALQGMLTGTVTAATALIATTVPRGHTGYAMGSLQTAIYIGASAGPLLGGIVADTYGYRAAFILTGALLFLAALVVLGFVREPHMGGPSGNRGRTTIRSPNLRSRAKSFLSPVTGSASVLALLGVRFLMRLGVGLPTPTLPLFVETIASPGTRIATLAGLTTGISGLAGAIGAGRVGKLSDRFGYRVILVICSMVSVLCYLPQSGVERPVWVVILQGGTGLAMGAMLASVSAALATLTPRGREGIVYGVEASVVSVASAISPLAGSAMAAYCGLRTPFLAAAGVFVLAGVVAFRSMRRS